MNTIIFCDTACNFPKGYLNESNDIIKMVNVPVTLNGDDYQAAQHEFSGQGHAEFYNKMAAGATVKTAAINPVEFEEEVEPFLKEGKEVMFFGFSSKLTASFDLLKPVFEKLEKTYPNKFFYIDTLSASMGVSIFIIRAVEMLKKGISPSEIKAQIDATKRNLKILLMVDDLKYLKNGGRISGVKAAIGTLLNVKPVISFFDGKLEQYGKAIGRKKGIAFLIEHVKKLGVNVADHEIVVLHSNAEKEAEEFVKEIKALVGEPANIAIGEICAVIGAHTGPGSLAVGFNGKNA